MTSAVMTADSATRTNLRTNQRINRGEAGRVLRELRAKDYVFTVLEIEHAPGYQRIKMRGNGFLKEHRPYPTMWVRLWFNNPNDDGAGHQRAFTLVNPDVATDTFWLEFVIHDGPAVAWATSAQPGDEIEASLYGSEPTLPECDSIDSHLLIGDLASLPAINSLLEALGPAPATILLEYQHPEDVAASVHVREGDVVRWVPRGGGGENVIAETRAELTRLAGIARDECATDAAQHVRNLPMADACPRLFAWAACDTVTTRTLTKMLRAAGLRKDCIKTLGYWQPA